VRTASRTLEIFEAFAKTRRPLTLTELAQTLSVPVSSCFGLVRAMAGRGYLQAANERKAFYPTGKMLRHAEIIAAHDPVIPRIAGELMVLRDRTDETVILGQLHTTGREVIYLEIVESRQNIRYSASVGDLKPLHSSAIGKALLAAMPEEQIEQLLKKLPLLRVTPDTLTSSDAVKGDLAKGRARGFQMTRGENVPDVAAVAVAVSVSSRIFGVAIAAPLHRMDAGLERCTAALQQFRGSIEKLV
jgi:DNA-binding IclR family transcriptional regulator